MSTADADLIEVAKAEVADRDHVIGLAELARVETRPQRGGVLLLDYDFAAEPVDARVARAVEASDEVLLVGRVGSATVGYCIVSCPGPVATIEEIFVHPEARSIGVGGALFTRARDWARAHGGSTLESQVLPGNRAAKNFFERVGLVTRKMRVSASLD